jgi:hypothetical protein
MCCDGWIIGPERQTSWFSTLSTPANEFVNEGLIEEEIVPMDERFYFFRFMGLDKLPIRVLSLFRSVRYQEVAVP